MVIPSRWMAGGRGLDEFRQAILGDPHMRELVDYPMSYDVFPGVEIKAGICYFLWDAVHKGDCNVTTIRGDEALGPISRKLNEYDVFVRDARAVSILRKVLKRGEVSVNTILTRDTAFGLASNFDGFHEKERAGDVPLFYIRKMKRAMGYIGRKAVTKSTKLIDSWKVLVPEAFNGGDALPHQIVGKPLIAPSPSACTQSFLFFHISSRKAAKSLQSYYTTRFFRFLVSQRKITQHALNSTYAWVPMQVWDRTWTDEELYAKYGITQKEQDYIESYVKAMNLGDDNDD
jgi:site-specific DNA-methyltransferase (adenine-specific)